MTFRSEVKTALEAVSGLSGKVFSAPADGGESVVPPEVAPPFVRIVNEFGRAPNLAGDGQTLATRRQFQLSLWQSFAAEDDTLTDAVIAAIDGLRVTSVSGYTHVAFEFSFRLEEREAGLAQHALTFSVSQPV